MVRIGELLRRVHYLLNRGRIDAALQQEMDAHRAMMGDPRRFGNARRLRDEAHDVWGWGWIDALVRDVRFSARSLRRTPMFTLVAVLSLALGLAVATSIIAIVNAYLIRTPPYPAADRMYHLRYAPPGPWEPHGMTGLDWTTVEDVVEFPIASAGESFYLGSAGGTVLLRGLRVTSGFVDGLGVSVRAGRRFTAQDFVAGSEPVAIIGHALWRDRFGSDPDAIGRIVRVEPESPPGSPETLRIVGILSPDFYYGRNNRTSADLLVAHPAPVRAYMVRLREGVPPSVAAMRLTEAARQAATSPLPPDWTGVELESVRERWIGELRPVLFGVTGAACLVVLIVCANLAVLMLLRSMQRQKEVAIRLALGSGWRHIARMLLTETSLICAAALAAGIALTAFTLGTLGPRIEAQLGRQAPSAAGIAIDSTVLLIVGAVSLLIAAAVSAVPLTSWGRGVTNALAQDARVASDGRLMRQVRSVLIAAEIAGSLVLLVGCGLMIRSVISLTTMERGFRADGLAVSRIMLRARNYPNSAFRSFHERFAGRVSELTGSRVVFSSWPPFIPPPDLAIEPDRGVAGMTAGAISVSAGYFSTFGIPVHEGREFTAVEASAEAPVAIISETLARRLWPNEGALGRRLRAIEHTPGGSRPGPWRTVVGIAGDVRQTYDDPARTEFYMPKTPDGRFGTFYVRTAQSGPALFDLYQRAAAEIDRDAVINPPRLVAGDDQPLVAARFLTTLLAAFAGLAGFLAMLGIYGVTAYAVQQRHKEVAIRVALGASDRTVLGIFLRQGALLMGAGTAAGLVAAVLLSRVLRHQLVGVHGGDVPVYVAACALLVTAGFAAVFWAARGAALRNPVTALNAG